jgi:hypothetical protein
MIRNPFRRSPRACDPQVAQRVLIASEGRRFSADVIETAVRMLRDGGGQARVLTIARLWGTSFGLPNPGLRPSKSEMAEQQDNVQWAIGELEKAGVDADGHIVTTRNPGKSILNEARRQNCHGPEKALAHPQHNVEPGTLSRAGAGAYPRASGRPLRADLRLFSKKLAPAIETGWLRRSRSSRTRRSRAMYRWPACAPRCAPA